MGGETFGGLNENADICAWIEMWFLHLELLITILLYGDILNLNLLGRGRWETAPFFVL